MNNNMNRKVGEAFSNFAHNVVEKFDSAGEWLADKVRSLFNCHDDLDRMQRLHDKVEDELNKLEQKVINKVVKMERAFESGDSMLKYEKSYFNNDAIIHHSDSNIFNHPSDY
jgi:hypothetical protein